MGLVDDDQVETPHAEHLLFIVNEVDHRLIGREQDAGINVSLLSWVAEVALRLVGQIGAELAERLLHQCCAVGQKQHVLHPVVPQ